MVRGLGAGDSAALVRRTTDGAVNARVQRFTSSGVARRSEQVLVRRVGVGDCPEDKMASSPHEHRQ